MMILFGLAFILTTLEAESHEPSVLPLQIPVHSSDIKIDQSQPYGSKWEVGNSENSHEQNFLARLEELEKAYRRSGGLRSGAECADRDKECHNYAKHCKKYEYVKKLCPKSCGICTIAEASNLNCKDNFTSSWCIKHKPECSSSPQVREKCQKTCGICLDECKDNWSPRRCTDLFNRNFCTFNQQVQLNCRKTCQTCVEANTCIDNDEDCDNFKKFCDSFLFVQHLCPRSCGTCDQETTEEIQKGHGCDCGLENIPKKVQPSRMSGNRIVGGTEATRHQYPWMAFIVNAKVPGKPRCGGSILNNRYVLTAAHCTYDTNCDKESESSHFLVTVAEHIVNSINDDVPGVTEEIGVENIIRHEGYCRNKDIDFDNDIALFRLSKEIELSEYPEIGTVCLPSSVNDNFYNSPVIVTGWGFLSKGKQNIFATTLQVVKLNRYSCKMLFPDQSQITDNMICAGDRGNVRDACQGDSGGPLTVKYDLGDGRARHVQIGIVSFGVADGTCKGWGVYTRVQNYLDWIRNHTQDGGCDNITKGGYQTIPKEELEKNQKRKPYHDVGIGRSISRIDDAVHKCECSLQNQEIVDFQNHIVGGRKAKQQKFPGLVYIQSHQTSDMSQLCAGSIINDLYILTAGHCTFKNTCQIPYVPQDLTVTVADHNIHSLNKGLIGITQSFTVKEIIRHENYCKSGKTIDNDIALLKLAKRMDLMNLKEVGMICLPDNPVSEYDHAYATAVEQKLTSDEEDKLFTSELNGVELIKFPNCALYPFPSHITENMFCAVYKTDTRDTCGGDSGGPLYIIENDSRYIQIGIVSFGPPGSKCAGLGVYTDIYKFLSWIREKSQDGTCG